MQPRITTQRLDESLVVVELEGEHDLSTVPELEGTLDRVLENGTSVILDLTGATFIDSSVLSQLFRARQRADADPREAFVVVAEAGSPPARLLDLTNAERVLDVYPTRQAALAALWTRDAAAANQ
jgi:anti-sigma B factor antagonist